MIERKSEWNTCQKDVVSKIAEEKGDSKICDQIVSREDYKRMCISSVANELNDISLCKQIEGSREGDGCYNLIAYSRQDVSICDNVQDEYNKNYCIKLATGIIKLKPLSR